MPFRIKIPPDKSNVRKEETESFLLEEDIEQRSSLWNSLFFIPFEKIYFYTQYFGFTKNTPFYQSFLIFIRESFQLIIKHNRTAHS